MVNDAATDFDAWLVGIIRQSRNSDLNASITQCQSIMPNP